jgi:hypothetical protein
MPTTRALRAYYAESQYDADRVHKWPDEPYCDYCETEANLATRLSEATECLNELEDLAR